MKILFICLGNICRSPLAEGIARKYATDHGIDIEIDSCGTSGWHIGESPDKRSIMIANKYGIDISKLVSRQINISEDSNWDYYFVMDENNKKDLINMGFDKDRIIKIGKFGANNLDVEDPYTLDINAFENMFIMLSKCIEAMFHSLYKLK